LILRKTIKIVATRCHSISFNKYIIHFSIWLKCTKFDFGWCSSAPDPAERTHSDPSDPLAGFKGPISKGTGGMYESGGGREVKGKREEKGRERKGRERK